MTTTNADVAMQVGGDGTLGTQVNGLLTTPCTTSTCNVTAGTQVGQNLFHSFDTFNVGTGGTVGFQGPAGVEKIVSRVTGHLSGLNPSDIDGTIKSNIDGANLFLMNPAGVLFHENVNLDLSGSFHVTTADYLRFGDGRTFNAVPGTDDQFLSSEPVAAFGFLGANPNGISLKGATLEVPSGQNLSLVSGDIVVENGALKAPGGSVELTSVDARGVVLYDQPQQSLDAFERLGEIKLSDAEFSPVVDVSDIRAGMVVVRGGSLELAKARVSAESVLGSSNGPIIIDVRDTFSVKEGGVIGTRADFIAQGADVSIRADTVKISDGGRVDTRAAYAAKGGSIDVTARTVILEGTGKPGQRTGFFTTAGNNSQPDSRAGNITVKTESLKVNRGASIVTNTFGAGASGDVQIGTQTERVESITLDGVARSGISVSTNGTGSAGNVEVWTGNLKITGGAQIQAATDGVGQGGSIAISADTVTLKGGYMNKRAGLFTLSSGTGKAGNIAINAGTIAMKDGAQINSSGEGTGDAGVVTIRGLAGEGSTAKRMDISNSSVTTEATTGDGGAIVLCADEVELAQSTVSSTVKSGEGLGGDITLITQNLLLTDGSQVAAASEGTGLGGNIRVVVTDTFRSIDSALSADATEAGGGNINLEGGRIVDLIDSGITTSVSVGQGRGGNIAIDSRFVIIDPSHIQSNAIGGPGGTITIVAKGLIRTPDSVIETRSQQNIDGQVLITAPDTDLSRSLTPLPAEFEDPGSRLRPPCIQQLGIGQSSFGESAHYGIPPAPQDFIPAMGFTRASNVSRNDAPNIDVSSQLGPRSSATFFITRGDCP
jgi:filamentous hemagglutinin family protein